MDMDLTASEVGSVGAESCWKNPLTAVYRNLVGVFVAIFDASLARVSS